LLVFKNMECKKMYEQQTFIDNISFVSSREFKKMTNPLRTKIFQILDHTVP